MVSWKVWIWMFPGAFRVPNGGSKKISGFKVWVVRFWLKFYLEVHGTCEPIRTVRTTVLISILGHLRGLQWLTSGSEVIAVIIIGLIGTMNLQVAWLTQGFIVRPLSSPWQLPTAKKKPSPELFKGSRVLPGTSK